MDTINPYAAPRTPGEAPLLPESAYDAWRSGNQLVVAHDATLPYECVKCNLPTDGRRKVFNLTWHPPLVFVGLLFGGGPYILLALLLQKKMTVEVSICDIHRRKRRNALLIGWLGALAGICLMFYSGTTQHDGAIWILLGGLTLMLAAIIFGFTAARIVAPKRIDKYYAWLSGACEEYLQSLPELPGGGY